MGTIIVIGLFVCAVGSAIALALFQNARDADEAWEKALEEAQNFNKKRHD